MKKALFAAVIVGLLVVGSASADKGRRIAGPICVNKATGVVRAVAEKPFQACRKGEIRRYGLYVKSTVTHNTKIIKGTPGPAGKDGVDGAPGKDGAPGAQGGQGGSGTVTVTQLDGDQANCVRITGSDGSSGVVCGTAGPKGDPGVCECKTENCAPETSKKEKH